MKLKIYQVDAFASSVFRGNPAAVLIVAKWPEETLMQKIAGENNLSETAFAVREGRRYKIRWFTPAIEVDLCGHATLASAHVLFTHYGIPGNRVEFVSLHSGTLAVDRSDELLVLDFPADRIEEVPVPASVAKALGKNPVRAFRGRTDYLLVYKNQDHIRSIRPDMGALEKLGERGVIVTAPGEEVDFVSRFFAPGAGIPEDPVTGSAHTTLVPYWSEVLGKAKLSARQISARGGELWCEATDGRVRIAGRAVTYMQGEICI